MTQKQSRVLLSLLSLGVFVILLGLGVWQLQRRDWKNDLLARLEQGLNAPPGDYGTPAEPETAPQSREFAHVRIHGRWLPDQSIRLFLATPDHARGSTREAFGYLLFTPLAFEGAAVFVNRGFLPDNIVAPPDNENPVTITGIIRSAEKPGSFTPAPDLLKRQFYAADIPAMTGLVKRQITQSEYIEASPNSGAAGWPKPRDPRELLSAISNRHLGYAATWFGLAATLVGVFGVYVAKM